MSNNFQAVIDWLMQYEQLKSFLYFNTSSEDLNNTSLNTITSDEFEIKYLRSGGIKNYDFAITYMGSYDKGTSNLNINELFDVQQFMDWINEQNKIENYPIFENGKVISVENLQNYPTFSGVAENEAVAKYMFQIRIKYLV